MYKKFRVTLFIIGVITYNLCVYFIYIAELNKANANINNIADAYWYSLVTLTTVGYGDFYPVSFWGRLIGFVFVIGSLGILSYLITELNQKFKNFLHKKEMGHLGTDMENHCVIIGWNDFSKKVVSQLINSGEQICIMVDDQSKIEAIRQQFKTKKCFVILSDFTDFQNLNKINITKSKRTYINFENDNEVLVYCISLKKHFPNINCVVTIDNIELKESFQFIGIKYIIPKSEVISKFVASYIFEPSVALLTDDLITTSNSQDNLDIHQKKITKENALVNQKFNEAYITQKAKYNNILIAIHRGDSLIKNPDNNEVIKENDILLFISNYNSQID